VSKRGKDATGVQRYLCSVCKKSFFPQTGTIFKDRKLPLSVYSDFLLQVFSCDSFASMSREERRSDATFWMGKLFAVLEGVQGDTPVHTTVSIPFTAFSPTHRIRYP